MLYSGLSNAWFRFRYGYSRPDPLMVDNWLVYTLRQPPHQYWYDVALPLTAHFVEEARATAAPAGALLVATIVPRDAQVDPTKLQLELEQYHLNRDEIDLDQPQRDLSTALEQSGISVLDLTPILRATPDSSTLFFAHDIHLTAYGHQVVASALAAWLEPMISTAHSG
jgi:hypothetical protein